MVLFTGLNSVIDRTIFTNKGPIVKKPLQILTGTNLQILNSTDISIPTANFVSSNIGYGLTITGSQSGRNDGRFIIESIISSTVLHLSKSNFNISDISLTTKLIISIANDIKNKYRSHRTESVDKTGTGLFTDVHGIDDIVNIISAPDSFDLTSAITLLNDIRAKFNAHVIDISGTPSVHKKIDLEDIIDAPISNGIKSAVYLANDIRAKYENHRKLLDVHYIDDSVNIIGESFVKSIIETYPGPLTGPLTWILEDLRSGIVANSTTDVSVLVNGIPAPADEVFGLLGAIVLTTKPTSTDTIVVNYDYIGNPPARFLRLNSPGFNLNQIGNKAIAGFPKHRYRSSSYLIDPSNDLDLMSPIQPEKVGWKYKGLERSNTASLNDPTSLLFNVPTNKVMYPVLFEKISEIIIKYDPVFLPDKSIDKWILNGDGKFNLAPGGNALTIIDQNSNTGPSSMPPFFHHEINVKALSIISSAFRVMIIDDNSLTLDGVFTGVTFGVSNGVKTAIVGFIITEATNLTSAIVLANSLKLKFNAHLINPTSHNPDDVQDTITIVDATSIQSLIILANKLKISYLNHISKGGGIGLTHKLIDLVNVLVSPDAKTLDSAITLLNELKISFNG
ncbi:MAG TPA: hypothetical protein ENI61_02940, partial [Ignavibacteria bacterium]|nr:hypothetical protein [Ignavibacteria bacterium]